MARILYLTDSYKVSTGYEPAFTKLLNKAGIHRHEVIVTDIYSLVDKPLKKRGNETVWRFDPEKLPNIRAAFAQRVNSIRPAIIVVSCPAILGVLTNGDLSLATLEKMRGGVYYYGDDNVPTIVTYPITAIHQRLDSRLITNDDGEEDRESPYRVPQGANILAWDWGKVGRFFKGKQRVLPPFQYSICRTLEDCWAAREYLLGCTLLSVDIETGNFPPQITCVGYTGLLPNGAVHSFVFPFYDAFGTGGTFWDSVEDHAIAWSVCRDINDSPIQKTFQNGAYDCSYFIRDRAPVRNYFLDSMILWWSIYMEMPKSLDFISSVLLDNFQYWKDDIKGDKIDEVGIREPSMERYWRYNALDTYYTLWDTIFLTKLLSQSKPMQWNYLDAMMRMFSGLRMSMRGIKADFQRRDEHRVQLTKDRDLELAKLRYMLCDNEFNINSPPQKASLLYDFMGLKPRNAKGRFIDMSKPLKGTNAPSAGAIPLKMAKYEHPLYKYLIEQLESAMVPDKQISNVCDMKLYTPRFRTAFNAVGTETTRFSTKKSNFWDGGNVQNIRGTYRDWLVADDDCIFLDVDYSQSDDVFIGYESEDPDKIAVIESGRDAHAVNGELFFGKSYEWIIDGKQRKDPVVVDPIKGIRQLTKKTSHGANFMMAAMTLYVTMGRDEVVAAAELLGYHDAGTWKQEQLVQLCGMLMGKYRKRYKRLNKNEWYADVVKELKDTGKMVNAFGITRNFLGAYSDNGTQREATAFIGQSGTAGNMNRVMAEIDHGFIPKRFRDGDNPDANEEARMMTWDSHGFGFHIQVHDNFVAQLNLKHTRWREAAHNLLYVMDRPIIIKGRTVRVRAEAAVGLRWGKKMLDWDGDIRTLDSLVHQLHSGKN